MELLQLRYFLEVAESEHVTHSAQKLRVSQPSLTQAISRLERELGVQLFEPEGRGIRLTEAGRFYSKRIAKAVGEIDSATSELARFDEERSSIVRINVVSASNIVVDAVAEWRAQHPAAKFQIVSSETASKIEPCDIEVRMQTGKTPEAKGARLFKERIMLAVPTTSGDETEERALRARLAEQETKSHMNLDDLFNRIEEGKQTDLNLIVKADVQGSIEALRDAFNKMDQSEVKINIVHSAVGGITETDVTLAAASDAIIIGFNVRPTGKSKQQAEKEKVDIRLYRVIYQAIEDINAARVGLLKPEIVEEDTGTAEVRETFKVPKVGTIAGCYITDGELHRDDKIRLVREGTVIFEGELASLKRFKDDVKAVKQGYECGIGIAGYQDLKVGDTIEGYTIKEVERTE